MRFREFRIIKEAKDTPLYTVGDSHAVAVAQAGGKNWVNLAVGGTASTNPQMLANISQIPNGATVLVSQGANDTASAMRNVVDSRGKTKLPPPQKIADNVANVVNKVQARGATVIFLLFPNGPKRGPGLAPFYGGDYQDEVRTAIKSTLQGVEIIDLNGKPLTDGIHATMNTYKDVANQISTKYGKGVNLGPAGASPRTTATKDKADTSELKKGPPYPPEERSAVMDMQKSLEELGYSVGPTGVDGKYGPNTAAALAAFKVDYEILGNGNTFELAAQEKMDKVKSGQIAQVKEPTKVFAGQAQQGAGATALAKEAVDFFKKEGWSEYQAVGIVGNLQAESGANLKVDAVGDNGKAYGIAQWHPPRQATFKKIFGKDIQGSSFREQLRFIQWELENTESKAGEYLKRTKTPEEAAWIFDQYYERSSGEHRQRRINNALALATQPTATA